MKGCWRSASRQALDEGIEQGVHLRLRLLHARLIQHPQRRWRRLKRGSEIAKLRHRTQHLGDLFQRPEAPQGIKIRQRRNEFRLVVVVLVVAMRRRERNPDGVLPSETCLRLRL